MPKSLKIHNQSDAKQKLRQEKEQTKQLRYLTLPPNPMPQFDKLSYTV
jgi:hypothetical protein